MLLLPAKNVNADRCDKLLNDYVKKMNAWTKSYNKTLADLAKIYAQNARAEMKEKDKRRDIKRMRPGKERGQQAELMIGQMSSAAFKKTIDPLENFQRHIQNAT